jgi:hypothetical protein
MREDTLNGTDVAPNLGTDAAPNLGTDVGGGGFTSFLLRL